MMTRTLLACTILLQSSLTPTVWAEPRSVVGTYRNPALGYSLKVPNGAKAVTGDQDGPERGVRIQLPSGGAISVFGEPNSLEYKSPEEGVADSLKSPICTSNGPEIKRAKIGKLVGAKGRIACDDHVTVLLLAFRPHGGPIYWLSLKTGRAHETEDGVFLDTIAGSFKLIRWE
jgi:hypothetical protein